jgi:hypothetical protein
MSLDLAHEIWAMAQGTGAIEEMAIAIAGRLDELVAEEREACAKVCEDQRDDHCVFYAALIRDRSNA